MIKQIKLIVLICLPIITFSQRNVEEYFPKGPDDYALSKINQIPAGSFSGTANFDIPLFEFDFDGIKVPISITYNTSGIKVAEIASRVGLGWALNLCNTTLSGEVMGVKDALSRAILPEQYDPNGNNDHQNFTIDLLDTGGTTNGSDIKPDIFYYSTLQSNSEFIFDASGSFGIPRPYNLDKITGGSSGVTITDENGLKTSFFNEGYIMNYSTCSSPTLDNRSGYNYKPNEIISTNGEKIIFDYKNSRSINHKYITSLIENKSIEILQKGYSSYEDQAPRPPVSICFNYNHHAERLLKNIDFPNGKIEFYYNDITREDLPGDSYLKRLVVKNNLNQLIRDYSFEYEYFTSTDPIPSDDIFSLHTAMLIGTNKKLKLKRVIDNLQNVKHEFTYYNEYNNFPNRLSPSYDYWGIYNGKNNTTSIATTTYRSTRYDFGPESRLYVGADKNPDINYGISGVLKEIKYPTGGITKISYEADDFEVERFTPPIYSYSNNFFEDLSTTGNMVSNSGDFTINNNSYNFNLLFYSDDKPQTSQSPSGELGDCTLKIFKYPNLTTPVLSLPTYARNVDIKEYYNQFTPGTYKMTMTSGYDVDLGRYHCKVRADWNEQTIVDNSNVRKAGTIRIKEIEELDQGQVKTIRKYGYNTPTSNYQKTSGKNIGDMYFSSIASSEYPRNKFGGWFETMYLTNNPGWNLSTHQGKAIGYTNVQEYYYSNDNKRYKKEYLFENSMDGVLNTKEPYSFLQISYPYKDFLRGYLLNETFFNAENDTVKKIEYQLPFLLTHYNQFSTSSPSSNLLLWGLEINHRITSCIPMGIPPYEIDICHYDYNFEIFNVNNYWVQPRETKVTEYVDGVAKIVSTNNTIYSNNPINHTFPIAQTTTNSLGETLKTEYYYPQDLSSSYEQAVMMNKLKDKNQIATPVITKSYNNGTPLSEQRIHYSEENGVGGLNLILPKYVYAKKGEIGTSSQVEDRKITYDKYDENGNLLQYTVENGIPVSIIWGYDGQYPIAKVEGKTYASLSNFLSSLLPQSNAGTLTPSSFDNLRALEGVLVTGYIYKPLVGVTTIIQPNGHVEKYNYDDAGRLKSITDKDGIIIKQIDYNYKNQ